MPVRHINFTGRKRLRSSDIDINLHDDVVPPTFEIVKLALHNYNLPPDALVYVEPYRQTSYMRFPCGTVGNVKLSDGLVLEEFDSSEAIRFRVKVTSSTGPTKGQLLADSPGISDSRVDSLLPVKPDPSLGQEVFRVDFTDEPILLVNDKLNRWKETVTDPVFASTVYPSVLRTILTRILCFDEPGDIDDTDDWRNQWIQFATKYLEASHPPLESEDIDDKDHWVDDVVAVFCRHNKVYDTFFKYMDKVD